MTLVGDALAAAADAPAASLLAVALAVEWLQEAGLCAGPHWPWATADFATVADAEPGHRISALVEPVRAGAMDASACKSERSWLLGGSARLQCTAAVAGTEAGRCNGAWSGGSARCLCLLSGSGVLHGSAAAAANGKGTCVC